MHFTVQKEIRFVPEFNKNKDLDPAEQIVVIIKNPSLSIKDRISARPETKARADVKGHIEGIDINFKEDDSLIVKTMVTRIENLSYDCGNDEKKINDAMTLLSSPVEFGPLLQEITDECKKILEGSEINEKN